VAGSEQSGPAFFSQRTRENLDGDGVLQIRVGRSIDLTHTADANLRGDFEPPAYDRRFADGAPSAAAPCGVASVHS
jgi:hypothetical protein